MQPRVITQIPRIGADIPKTLAAQGVATVHEAQGKGGLLESGLRPIKHGWSICGPAITSLNHVGDNLMVHAALDVCQPGDVLVIAVRSPSTCGMIGELLARQALHRGVAGIIVDAGVRDVAELRELGVPIWSKAISAGGTVKATPGCVNVPVVCGGATIHPGDLIVADDDGVVVVSHQQAQRVRDAAVARTERETQTRRAIQGGELTLDLHNLRKFLENQGVSWSETPE